MQTNSRNISNRLSKKISLFRILAEEPGLSANALKEKAKDHGIELTLISAYRTLRSFRENASVEDSEVRCLRIVSSILQNASAGKHFSAMEIKRRADELGQNLHKSTIYRVLDRLYFSKLVVMMHRAGQKHYEWKRDESHHGHLICIKCDATIEFNQENLDEIALSICSRTGFEFGHMEFVLRSICANCR